MIMTIVARRRSGAYSAVSAMPLGMAPPRPSPARKRQIRSSWSPVDVVATRVRTPKTAVQTMITTRRPNLSATTPKDSAPISNPTRLATNSGPSSGRVRCSSCAIEGATKAMDCVS